MKIRTRIIAVALCIVSIVSLAACSEKTAEIKPAETQGAQTVVVGTILSEPEKTTADIGKAYLKFTMQDEANQSKKDTMYLAFDMTGKDMILYFADGDKQANEIIFEVAQVGKSRVAKYTKNATSNAYKKDKKKMKVLAKEALEMLSFLEVFGIGVGTMTTSQYRYKKCENEKSEVFGDVYVYELLGEYSDDETYGYIWVDKESGVWVKTLDNDKEEVCSILELELENVEIPMYK